MIWASVASAALGVTFGSLSTKKVHPQWMQRCKLICNTALEMRLVTTSNLHFKCDAEYEPVTANHVMTYSSGSTDKFTHKSAIQMRTMYVWNSKFFAKMHFS